MVTKETITCMIMIMILIMNLYSAKTTDKYSKALYIKIKFKFKIPKSYNNITTMIFYAMVKTEKLKIKNFPTN